MTYLEEIARAIADAVPGSTFAGPERRLFLIYAVLATSIGAGTELRHVHDAWVAWMEGEGRTHESMVPFDQLSKAVQDEDRPFRDAIRSVAAST